MTRHEECISSRDYPGEELQLFRLATNWKRYLASRLRPWLQGAVLEVGAGMGTNIPYFHHDGLDRWVSLEPDRNLCELYRRDQAAGLIPRQCELVEGTIQQLSPDQSFDTILYVDVLEHVKDDRAEFRLAFERLRPAGCLLILCPAHNVLYSPFDKSIGHFRRYDKPMYRGLSDIVPVRMEYLDTAGVMVSLLNKCFLRQAYPSESQVKLWDRIFVRLSQVLDPITMRVAGKSLLGVWKKDSVRL